MVRFYSKNLLYEIDYVSESSQGETMLFRITKSVFSDENCDDIIRQIDITKRLRVDDEGNVYTSAYSKTKWFNWRTLEIYKYYSIH